MNKILSVAFVSLGCLLCSCAGERQGLVCEEIEYRLNTMAYSPDQRAYMEEELNTCRAEEAQKKAGSAETRKSIYDRYAASGDSLSKSTNGDPEEVSVSKALKDSSGVETTSIYDRYSNKTENEVPMNTSETASSDTSASDVSNFQ